MTLAALWSRQGKLMLTLAFLAATVALLGVSLWANANSASADIPLGTTVTLTQDKTSTVDITEIAGCDATHCVTYTADIQTFAPAASGSANATFEIQADPNLWPVAFGTHTGAWAAASCSISGGALHNNVVCTIPGPVDDGTVVITYHAIPYKDFSISGPMDQVLDTCEVYDNQEPLGQGVQCTQSPANLDLTINPWDVNPENAENGPGQPHTIVFTLPQDITCYSSIVPPPIAQDGTGGPGGEAALVAPRACSAADVGINTTGGTPATLVGVPVVSNTTLAGSETVTVVINKADPGTVDVALDVAYITHFGNPQLGPNSYDLIDPIAHKTYGVVGAAGEGRIRHVDLPDKGTEDAADGDLGQEEQPYCSDVLAAITTPTATLNVEGSTTSTPPPTSPVTGTAGAATTNPVLGENCGVLNSQDDIDDAVGSFHGACLLGTLLTYTVNDGDLTWHIDPVPPGSGPDAESVSTFGGPNDEPCVMWGSATTGTQSIYVVYHEGEADEETFFYDYDPDLELIKEWNTIEETRIIGADGDIGETDDTLFTNTQDFANWTQRDCSEIPEVPDDNDPDTSNIGFCDDANLDTLLLEQEGSLIINSINGTLIRADGVGFIDYTMGSHADAGGAYTGPVDGAEQEYSVTGDCGSVRLEDPSTGNVIFLAPDGSLDGSSATILSSDKGVGFEIFPNDDGAITTTADNAECGPNAVVCVHIDTANQANQFSSFPTIDNFIEEEVCVEFTVGPPTSGKTPLLAWAGQRVVLEHWWGDPETGECLITDDGDNDDEFAVLYSKQNGKGGFTAQQVGSTNDTDQTNDDVIVDVDNGPTDRDEDDITDPNSNCTSRAIYESEDETEADISSYVVDDDDNLNEADPRSQQVPYVIYFLKFEDVTLGLVDGDSDYSAGPGATGADLSDIEDSSTDVESIDDANVSANVLARVRVRGWVETTNCPARPSGIGENGEFLPANRCIFPDDWRFKAGGGVQNNEDDIAKCISTQVLTAGFDANGHPGCALNDAPEDNNIPGIPEETFPKMDINKLPSRGYSPATQGCQDLSTGAEGPFSLLDGLVTEIVNNSVVSPSNLCDDTLAPYVAANGGFPGVAGNNCRVTSAPAQPGDDALTGQGGNGPSYDCRETVFPDGVIDAWDAPMPPALIRFALTGVGYLAGANKADVYTGNTNQFYDSNIPAEPWIAPCNADGECYQWNSYGAAGGKDGPYTFWTDFASHGPVVISCAGETANPPAFLGDVEPCPDDADPAGVSTCPVGSTSIDVCGYKLTRVYTDNHGEAMTWINGDADLDFSECDDSTPTAGLHDIVLLDGIYCEEDTPVGEQSLTALAQYPDKVKHFAEGSEEVTITRTWGGNKEVTACRDLNTAESCELEGPGLFSQFHYVVFHVTDRDGLCGKPVGKVHTQLHSVLFEEVQFHIDSPTGVIVVDRNGNKAAGPDELGNPPVVTADGKQATTHTFATGSEPSVENGGLTVEPVLVTGECQAWIHISESQFSPVNVIVTAFDPEGTVTFDNKDINQPATPTPPPTAEPTDAPTASPIPTQDELWADVDCNGDVGPVDSLKMLIIDAGQTPSQEANCPDPEEVLDLFFQDGDEFDDEMWGDADCDGDVDPVDSLKVLIFDAGQFYLQQEPCPDIASEVQIPVQS